MENKYQEFLEFAIKIASGAGEKIMEFDARRREPIWTSPTHFKTKADDASDALMRKAIIEAYPDHNILSEEGMPRERRSRYTWVLDGIDGTIPFSTGISDHFVVSVCLCEDLVPVVGVNFAPKRKELYSASLGGGAFLNKEPIKVSDVSDISKVILGCDFGKDKRVAVLPYLTQLERALAPSGIACKLSLGSAATTLSFVADGKITAYIGATLQPEDMAAAVVIIREAGGKVTNLDGERWKLGDQSILAANPILHAKLVNLLELKKIKVA